MNARFLYKADEPAIRFLVILCIVSSPHDYTSPITRDIHSEKRPGSWVYFALMAGLFCGLHFNFGPLVATTLVAQLVPDRVFDGCGLEVCPGDRFS